MSSPTPVLVDSPSESSGGGSGIFPFILGIIILVGGAVAVYYFFFYKKGERLGMFSCNDDGNCVSENVYLKKDCDKKCQPKPQPPFYIKASGPGKPKDQSNAYWSVSTGNNLSLGAKATSWFVGLVNKSDKNPRIWTVSSSGILCLAHPTTTDRTQITLSNYDTNSKTQEIGTIKNKDGSLSFYFLDNATDSKKDFVAADPSKNVVGCMFDSDQSSNPTFLWNWTLEN